MPKKLRPFQRELKERENDRARIERELKLRQRIYGFAELSEKERKRRFAFLIAEKQRQYLQNLSDDGELDSDSSSDAETTDQSSSTQLEENLLRTFRYNELILGFILGLFVSLVISFNISNE
jgi:hypothetical protein